MQQDHQPLRTYRRDILPVLWLFAIAVGVVMPIAYFGGKAANAGVEACSQKGGVVVRVPKGTACIKAEVIK